MGLYQEISFRALGLLSDICAGVGTRRSRRFFAEQLASQLSSALRLGDLTLREHERGRRRNREREGRWATPTAICQNGCLHYHFPRQHRNLIAFVGAEEGTRRARFYCSELDSAARTPDTGTSATIAADGAELPTHRPRPASGPKPQIHRSQIAATN